MRRRTIFIIAVLVLVAAGAGYYFYTNNTRASAAAVPANQTVEVRRGNLIATVNGAGPLAARAQVMLNFGTGGTVKQVYVKVGDVVKQGEVLAELDATELQLALANAQLALNQQIVRFEQTKAGPTTAEVAAARASNEASQASYESAVKKANLNDEQLVIARVSLDRAVLALQKAQSDYDKAITERKTDVTIQAANLQQAKLEYESSQANYNIQIANINDTSVRSAAASLASSKSNLAKLLNSPTQEELQLAQAQLEQSRISLAQAQYRLRNAQIIAPFDGIVTQVNIENFFSAAASTQAIQLSDLSRLQVTVNIAEVDIGKVKNGQEVNITLDALPDRPQIKGRVEQTALVAVTTQNVVNYPVLVVLESPDTTAIKTGMTANVGIIVERRDNVLLVPNRAVRTVNRQRVVQLESPTGSVQTPVQIGLQNETQSEVLSGLTEGVKVIIPQATTTRPGAPGPGGGPGGPGGPGGGPVFAPR